MLRVVTVRQLGESYQPMLTWGSVEAQALRKRGWSVSAIARQLGRDRKTVRAYLSGQREPGKREPGKREPGKREPARPDRFGRFAEYCRIRFPFLGPRRWLPEKPAGPATSSQEWASQRVSGPPAR
jgi:hypothetical protein